jgi:Kef-type K+ transport system membrane component KefB/Trk K+ transport system NAD-binding subunit
MQQIFTQLSLIFLVVLGVSFAMRILKQPLIVGYILSGVIVGPLFLNFVSADGTLSVFAEMGVAFLLFIVGLYLSPKIIKEVGGISLITGIGQIIFTVSLAYIMGILLGFSFIVSIFVAIAITFSSTIIVMKLLSDKDDLDKLYGKVSMGMALVQNLIAIFSLVIIASLYNDTQGTLWTMLFKGIFLFGMLFVLGHFVFPKLGDFFAKSSEFLFLFAIAWGLGISLLFVYFGFSIEIGALMAGIVLSVSPYSQDIGTKLKPLRDFFIISFFILLGSQIVFTNFADAIVPVICFSLLILIGNPLSVMIVMGIMKYSKKTGFMAGLTVAQISEFSLILVAFGVKAGQISAEILSMVTMIALITIAGSTYMIIYSDKLYDLLSKRLSIFERKDIKEKEILKKSYKYILIGENRVGFPIMKTFMHSKKDYLIIDFNPVRVKKLVRNSINCIYGDVSNSDFLDEIDFSCAEIIVSTVPEKEVNIGILNKLKSIKSKATVIVTARKIADTFELYNLGAEYVILPHFLGGDYVANLIDKAKTDSKIYEKEKEKQIKDLKERLQEGQVYPETQRDV